MRRTKEEAEITKKRLLEAAFEQFYENGVEGTSLEQICSSAQVTRGAAYWHFKNKHDIFEQTVRNVLHDINTATKDQIQSNPSYTVKEALVEMLWLPHRMPRYFEFIRKTTVFISMHESFAPLMDEIHAAKLRQYSYFVSAIANLRENNPRLALCAEQETAAMLYSLFEGIYNGDVPDEIRVNITKQMLVNYINLLVDR